MSLQELEEKKSAANAKLKEMLGDQQKAEEEKRLSEHLQCELAEQITVSQRVTVAKR